MPRLTLDGNPLQEFYEAVKAASKASLGLEDHYRDVVAPAMEDTPTLRTIAMETKKGLLNKIDVSFVHYWDFGQGHLCNGRPSVRA